MFYGGEILYVVEYELNGKIYNRKTLSGCVLDAINSVRKDYSAYTLTNMKIVDAMAVSMNYTGKYDGMEFKSLMKED